MKKFISMMCAFVMVLAFVIPSFSLQASALTSKPSNYNTFIAGNSVNFSGSSKTFYFTNSNYRSVVWTEVRVYDPDASDSLWLVELKAPGNNSSFVPICYVSSTGGIANYDYEQYSPAKTGQYTVRVTNIYGASSSNMKSATFFMWGT